MHAHGFCNGTTLVADGSNQGAHVMHATNEDGSAEDPEQGGHPAKCSAGEDWSGYRTGGCDGGEVLPCQELGIGRYIVQAIFQLNRRHRMRVVKFIDLLGDKCTVGFVGDKEDYRPTQKDKKNVHESSSLRKDEICLPAWRHTRRAVKKNKWGKLDMTLHILTPHKVNGNRQLSQI